MADLANGSPSLMSAGFWKVDNPMAWLVGAVTLGVIYIAYRKFTADDTPTTTDTSTDTTPSVLSGGGASVYRDESFPLVKGMKGKNVEALQKALNILLEKHYPNEPKLVVDGKLWTATLKVVGLYYNNPNKLNVTEEQFNKIVSTWKK